MPYELRLLLRPHEVGLSTLCLHDSERVGIEACAGSTRPSLLHDLPMEATTQLM